MQTVSCFKTKGVNFKSKSVSYTFKILFGWCALGPMNNQTRAGIFGCDEIMFVSADTVKPGIHYFSAPTELRENSI